MAPEGNMADDGSIEVILLTDKSSGLVLFRTALRPSSHDTGGAETPSTENKRV